MTLSEIVSSRLKELFKNETQIEVAQKLNMTQGNISRLVNGEQDPKLDTLIKISQIYHVSIDWILGLKDSREVDSINTESMDYSQVFLVLAKLEETKTIIPAQPTETVIEDFGDEDADEANESVTTEGANYDLLKINDPTISFLLRRRMKLIDVDQSIYDDWKEKHLSEYQGIGLLNCDEALKKYMNDSRTGNIDGDWSSSLAEYSKKIKGKGENDE